MTRPGTNVRRVLHLVGASEDNGGILSTIRGFATGGVGLDWEHVLWMNRAFVQTRQPRLECRMADHALDETPSHLRFLMAAWRAWPELKALLNREHFDVVHGHSRGALPLVWWLARRRRPVLFTNHTYARRVGMYRKAAATPGMTSVLLTPNQARHYGIQPEPGRVEIISSCGSDRFFDGVLRDRRPAASGVIQLVGVGNIVRWKKWDLLLRAVQGLPETMRRRVRVSLWGPVPSDADSQRFAAELEAGIRDSGLGDGFRLMGPTQDVEGVLAGADWFVLPSTNEPCSVALTEALASGVPAIASASGGNVDILVEGRTGTLFDPDSAESLRGRLLGILEGRWTPVSAHELRESVRCRSARVVSRQYAELYGRLAGRR